MTEGDGVKDAGLQIARLERIGRLFTVLCDMTKQAISEIRLMALRWSVWLLCIPIFTVLVGLERLGMSKRSAALTRFTTGYVVLATKVREPEPLAACNPAIRVGQ